jgi:hypothetical protein
MDRGKTHGKFEEKVGYVKKLPAHRAGLPGNDNMIIGSAFLPAPEAGRRGFQPTCP